MNYTLRNSLMAIGALVVMAIILFVTMANANPSQLSDNATNATATATTTRNSIQPGVGTTTITVDTQSDGGFPANSGVLMLYVTASSTNSQVVIKQENSMDGSTWFTNTSTATTSRNTVLSGENTFFYQYASTSPGVIGAGTTGNTGGVAVEINTPLRWVRFIIAVPPGSANSMIWANFVMRRENR